MIYRGNWIDTETFEEIVTVEVCGDVMGFDTVDEAKLFIDEVIMKGNEE